MAAARRMWTRRAHGTRRGVGTLSRGSAEALSVTERETLFRDCDLSGFGVQVYPAGAKVYLVQTSPGGTSRRVTLGRHGVPTAEQARRKAAQVIADIKAGDEPSQSGNGSQVSPGRSRRSTG